MDNYFIKIRFRDLRHLAALANVFGGEQQLEDLSRLNCTWEMVCDFSNPIKDSWRDCGISSSKRRVSQGCLSAYWVVYRSFGYTFEILAMKSCASLGLKMSYLLPRGGKITFRILRL